MKHTIRKLFICILIMIRILIMTNYSSAHSGRTDSNGGHKDNNNVSGLGPYHYHCGGNPAHLHPNGVCPYSTSSSSSQSSTSSTSSTSKTNTIVPSPIAVSSIQINENIESIEVGKSKILTASITPNNATDKSVIWKSSDENIATISSTGEVIAKKSGVVDITASTSNGKSSTIRINIKEEPKIENNVTIKTSTNNKDNTNVNSINNNQENSSFLGGILILGLLGGAGYLGYKRNKR